MSPASAVIGRPDDQLDQLLGLNPSGCAESPQPGQPAGGMDSATSLRFAQNDDGISYRVAVAADLPQILALDSACFGQSAWSESSWQAELEPGHQVLLALQDGRLLGTIALSSAGEWADLLRVMVDPGHRRRRIGRRLVAAGIAWAQSQSVSRLLLEVEADNTPALGLYQSFGWYQIDRRSDYYGPGRDAIIMELALVAASVNPSAGHSQPGPACQGAAPDLRPGTDHAGEPGTDHAGGPGTDHAGGPGTDHARGLGTGHEPSERQGDRP